VDAPRVSDLKRAEPTGVVMSERATHDQTAVVIDYRFS
jgi:hypothetical protein